MQVACQKGMSRREAINLGKPPSQRSSPSLGCQPDIFGNRIDRQVGSFPKGWLTNSAKSNRPISWSAKSLQKVDSLPFRQVRNLRNCSLPIGTGRSNCWLSHHGFTLGPPRPRRCCDERKVFVEARLVSHRICRGVRFCDRRYQFRGECPPLPSRWRRTLQRPLRRRASSPFELLQPSHELLQWRTLRPRTSRPLL